MMSTGSLNQRDVSPCMSIALLVTVSRYFSKGILTGSRPTNMISESVSPLLLRHKLYLPLPGPVLHHLPILRGQAGDQHRRKLDRVHMSDHISPFKSRFLSLAMSMDDQKVGHYRLRE